MRLSHQSFEVMILAKVLLVKENCWNKRQLQTISWKKEMWINSYNYWVWHENNLVKRAQWTYLRNAIQNSCNSIVLFLRLFDGLYDWIIHIVNVKNKCWTSMVCIVFCCFLLVLCWLRSGFVEWPLEKHNFKILQIKSMFVYIRCFLMRQFFVTTN